MKRQADRSTRGRLQRQGGYIAASYQEKILFCTVSLTQRTEQQWVGPGLCACMVMLGTVLLMHLGLEMIDHNRDCQQVDKHAVAAVCCPQPPGCIKQVQSSRCTLWQRNATASKHVCVSGGGMGGLLQTREVPCLPTSPHLSDHCCDVLLEFGL